MRCVPLVVDGHPLGLVAATGPLTPSDIDAVKAFRRILQEQHLTEQATAEAAPPPPPPAPVDITDLAPWVAADKKFSGEIAVLTLRLKELTEARDTVRAKVQERMGDAHEARINGRPAVKWAPQKAGTYLDQKRLSAEQPALVAKYQATKKASRPYVFIEDGTS